MNYQLFLYENQLEDSPWAKQEFQAKFGGADNLGLSSPPEFDFASGDRIFGPTGNPGKMWDAPSGHASAAGGGGMTADYRTPIEREAFRNEVFDSNPLDGTAPITEYSDLSANREFLLNADNSGVVGAESLGGLLEPTSTVSSAPPALRTGAWTQAAGSTMYGGEQALAAETAAESGWGGPEVFAGNMALSMIPTRDRNKANTPLGDEGSYSGILKGGGKGALIGGTLSGGNPYAIAGGAALGTWGGAQGYFDSTSAPQIQISRIKRGRMPQGLLGGGSIYG